MPIALDTNVLWPVLTEAQPAVSILTPIIESYNTSDGLVVCGAVYAELLAGPGATAPIVDAALARVGIVIDDAFPLALWREAGLAYRAYAERRLASEGALPRRILADFINRRPCAPHGVGLDDPEQGRFRAPVSGAAAYRAESEPTTVRRTDKRGLIGEKKRHCNRNEGK